MAGNDGQHFGAEGLRPTTIRNAYYHEPVSVEEVLKTQMIVQPHPMLRLQSCENMKMTQKLYQKL